MTGPIGEPYSADRAIKRLQLKIDKFDKFKEWVNQRYKDEVTNRPMDNIHREVLRVMWEQVKDKLDSI